MRSLTELRTCLPEWLHRYKYVLVVVCAGLLLLMWPTGESVQESAPQSPDTGQSAAALETAIEQMLSRAEGVGEVAVRLSVSAGEQVTYAQESESDSDRRYAEGFLAEEHMQQSCRVQLIDRGEGEEPVVLSRQSPTYQGALVVCEGADTAGVRLLVTQAVASMTGLGADRIVIMKMK